MFQFQVLKTEEEISRVIDATLRESPPYVYLDIETTGLDQFKDRILDIQISSGPDKPVYMFSGEYAKYLLSLRHLTFVGHNLRFDLKMLYRAGVDLTDSKWEDTMLLSHLLDEDRDSYSLDSLIQERWQDDYKERFWAKYDSYESAPGGVKADYACRDAFYTAQLHGDLRDHLNGQSVPDSLIGSVHGLAKHLCKTEIQGLEIDLDYLAIKGLGLNQKIQEYLPKLKELGQPWIDLIETEMWEKAIAKYKTEKGKASVPKPEFSFDSPKQLMDLVYGKLALPLQINDQTKNPSLDDSALEKLKGTHPLIDVLREYRGVNKVYGSYIEGTLSRAVGPRIYPEFRVNGTVTGRISHSNPNLGQLPANGGIRGIYRAGRDNFILSADFSQLEVCIEANLTGDVALRDIFLKGRSKHDITSEALGITRDEAKTLNFALQYWASHFKVAKLLGISPEEGLKVWNKYWRTYSGPKALKYQTDAMVNQGRPIVSLFGRKRRFPVRNRQPWDGDYRQAYNFLIQSTGADITSLAFFRISEWLLEKGYGRGLFTVHDEILIEVKKEHWEECEKKLLETMVQVGYEIGLKIPLKAESSGPQERWSD